MFRNLLQRGSFALQKDFHRIVRYANNTSSKLRIVRRAPDETVDEIYKRFQDKILFSSYYDSLELKLGYKINKIVLAALQKKEQKLQREEAKLQIFPLALKYMTTVEDVDHELIQPAARKPDLQESNDKNIVVLPYAKTERKIVDKDAIPPPPKDWLKDYEYYNDSVNREEEEETETDECSQYGTPDHLEPVSKVPCSGCGATLHCADQSLPGYIPSEIFKGRTDSELTTIICQRCHFLMNYNTAINITVTPEDYIKVISSIKDRKALALLMVDILDLPCSIWPEIRDILGHDRPIIVVANKIDLVPKDSKNYLGHIKSCVEQQITEAGFENVKHVALISAKTGYGVEELITKIHTIWGRQGDVYLVGCTNVGKSSLFNALLKSDFCMADASNLIKRATASPWPGTTLKLLKFPILRPSDYRLAVRANRLRSERVQKFAEEKLRRDQARKTGSVELATLIGHIGQSFKPTPEQKKDPFGGYHFKTPSGDVQTFNDKAKRLELSKWCYDTPGVMQPAQILNLLTTEELLKVIPKEMIRPRAFSMRPGLSLFLAGLGRVDYLEGIENIRMLVFSSPKLPILIVRTESASELYEQFLGTPMLEVPSGGEERLAKWPELQSSDKLLIVGKKKYITACDVLLSSAGWIAINIPEGHNAIIKAWTPEGRGIVVRDPSLLPHGIRLKGPRIRGSIAYRNGKAFIND